MTEQDHINAAQDAIIALKKHLREIQKINQGAGRNMAANAAMRAHGAAEVLHADCLTALEAYWSPEQAEQIAIRGGGDR